jgi:hypothetical protein
MSTAPIVADAAFTHSRKMTKSGAGPRRTGFQPVRIPDRLKTCLTRNIRLPRRNRQFRRLRHQRVVEQRQDEALPSLAAPPPGPCAGRLVPAAGPPPAVPPPSHRRRGRPTRSAAPSPGRRSTAQRCRPVVALRKKRMILDGDSGRQLEKERLPERAPLVRRARLLLLVQMTVLPTPCRKSGTR